MRRLSSLVLLLLIFAPHARAQIAPPTEPQAILVTIGPGDEVWEKFGHNMLWLRSPQRGIDLCYNWGLFDFDQPGFIANFIRGRPVYTMDGERPEPILGIYFDQNRHATMQRLRLTPAQIDRLIDLCEENRKPANKDYRYDYFKDNCSTRVRDMIDRATDGGLQPLKQEFAIDGRTYRWHCMRLTQSDPLTMTGMDFTFGPATDKPLTKWEECFLPESLSLYVAPLVDRAWQPWPSARPELPQQPPKIWLWLLLIAVMLVVLIFAFLQWPRTLSFLIGFWWVITFLGGLFLFFMGCTDHVAAHWNRNFLLFSPFAAMGLAGIILKLPPLKRGAAMFTFYMSIWAALPIGLSAQPAQNKDFVFLAIPVHAMVAFVYRRRKLTEPGSPGEVAFEP